MFCPVCRSEYREGFSICAGCQVALVPDLPPETAGDPDLELVHVFDTDDPAVLEIAKSILRDADLEFIDLGEGVQDFYGMGATGAMHDLTGETGLLVAREKSELARELLSELMI